MATLISDERYEALLETERVFAALEAHGVDNWEGYEDAMASLEDED